MDKLILRYAGITLEIRTWAYLNKILSHKIKTLKKAFRFVEITSDRIFVGFSTYFRT